MRGENGRTVCGRDLSGLKVQASAVLDLAATKGRTCHVCIQLAHQRQAPQWPAEEVTTTPTATMTRTVIRAEDFTAYSQSVGKATALPVVDPTFRCHVPISQMPVLVPHNRTRP